MAIKTQLILLAFALLCLTGSIVRGQTPTITRTCKGPVCIAECHPDGRYITLENSGFLDKVLSYWKLNRVVDGLQWYPVTLPKGFHIPSDKLARICGTDHQSDCSPPNDIVVNIPNWGIGANITTTLLNPMDEVLSTIQQIIYE